MTIHTLARLNDGSGHGGMVMQMMTVTLAMLLCFQVKHFVADYLLQPGWVLRGKGDMRQHRRLCPCRACMRWARCRPS